MTPPRHPVGITPSFRLLRRLLVYTRPHRLIMVAILALTILASLGMNFPPVLIRNAIDRWITASTLPLDVRMMKGWTGLYPVPPTMNVSVRKTMVPCTPSLLAAQPMV